jgi:S1-C subfamily serine protease
VDPVYATQKPPKGMQAVKGLALLVAVVVTAYVTVRIAQNSPSQSATSTPVVAPTPTAKSPLFNIAGETPAVLTIVVYDRSAKPVVQGSGFVLNSTGLAATNVHVLQGAYDARAVTGDDRWFQIQRVEGFDEGNDVVVFQLVTQDGVTPSDLKHVTLGSTAQLLLGDHIATISSPEGLPNTVTDGVVSAIRSDGDEKLLQISAPISHGSSGGPIFDAQGKVVGIAVAQFSNGQNLNFAMPVETVTGLLSRRAELTLAQFRILVQAQTPPPAVARAATHQHHSPPAAPAGRGVRRGHQQAGHGESFRVARANEAL